MFTYVKLIYFFPSLRPWANYSEAFPEEVRQCRNATAWKEHCPVDNTI